MSEAVMQRKIDYMVEKFQSITKDIDDFKNYMSENNALILKNENKFLSFYSLFENLKSELKQSLESFVLIQANHNSKISFQEQNYASLSSKVFILEDVIAEHKNQLDANSQKVKFSIDKFNNYVPKNDFEQLNAVIVKINQNCLEAISKLKMEFQEEIAALKNSISHNQNINRAVKEQILSDVMQFGKDILLLKSSIDINKNLAKEDILEIKSYVNNAVQESIRSIPKPVIPSLDEAKDFMKQNIEPVSLDAKNANARSANNETKIMILEKKLESLNLALNKISLGT
jgi:hypothetical protein